MRYAKLNPLFLPVLIIRECRAGAPHKQAAKGRQIAGAVARRIVNYAKEGQTVTQGTDAGFIKFGSRVDVFLPIETSVLVEEGQIVKGGVTLITSKN